MAAKPLLRFRLRDVKFSGHVGVLCVSAVSVFEPNYLDMTNKGAFDENAHTRCI